MKLLGARKLVSDIVRALAQEKLGSPGPEPADVFPTVYRSKTSDYTEQSPPSEANNCSDNSEILRDLWLYCRVQKNPQIPISKARWIQPKLQSNIWSRTTTVTVLHFNCYTQVFYSQKHSSQFTIQFFIFTNNLPRLPATDTCRELSLHSNLLRTTLNCYCTRTVSRSELHCNSTISYNW
jgi:hypothetical protein